MSGKENRWPEVGCWGELRQLVRRKNVKRGLQKRRAEDDASQQCGRSGHADAAGAARAFLGRTAFLFAAIHHLAHFAHRALGNIAKGMGGSGVAGQHDGDNDDESQDIHLLFVTQVCDSVTQCVTCVDMGEIVTDSSAKLCLQVSAWK